MRLLISAGEASGEVYGARLIDALRALRGSRPELEFFGVGGEQMRRAGCDLIVNANDIAVVGLAEVVEHLPRIFKLFHRVVAEAEHRRPDAAVLIDFPDFNFRLARDLHKRGIPVIYYVSPQLWAWRQSRIELVRKYVRKMLVIFPFEEKFYRERGIEAEFVGHPLADMALPTVTREDFAKQYGIDPQRQWIALLPGSRRGEVARILPKLLQAAQLLGPEHVYIVPVASTLDPKWMASFLPECRAAITLSDDARSTLLHARAAAVASGTSTLEAALIGTPFAMVYQVAPLTWTFGRRLVRVDRFAMPNLIAERDVVLELVQENFTPERVCAELRRLLPDSCERQSMLTGFDQVKRNLRGSAADSDASGRAARAVLAALEANS
ncbi:MAG TPA: lipid-A-disaccharide synthase [Candidatus Eisenbacteria bacterium]|nr:lipid-A-disaccharide synthase [Candidatus Eisenbacteria bacterium]